VRSLYVPFDNKEEAALIDGINIYGCKTLSQIVAHLGGTLANTQPAGEIEKTPHTKIFATHQETMVDFKDIKGQASAKRALEIAACGGHNIALYGPPGTGKTMLARAFTGILPSLSHDEMLEVTRIHSLATKGVSLLTHPPLRSPHHTSSHVSLVGGGTNPRPGEVTLAHRGVLFLDEFPEFDKKVIESLREPLEEGVITVSRAKGSYTFPASCTLIASMNPCPCGYLGSKHKRCICKPSDIDRYARKLSGPIMDRIDMWVPVLHVDYDTLNKEENGRSSGTIRKTVQQAREFAKKRFEAKGGTILSKNKDMRAKDIDKYVTLDEPCTLLMKKLATSSMLSPRAYHRVLRLARTIADYRGDTSIQEADILEAFQYRPKLYQDRL
jgi:magnesium chelatase family protein